MEEEKLSIDELERFPDIITSLTYIKGKAFTEHIGKQNKLLVSLANSQLYAIELAISMDISINSVSKLT